jgi:competence protein ComEA
MMRRLRKIVTTLLGFDRRERRGTCVLAVMLTILLLVRVLVMRPGREPRHNNIFSDYASDSRDNGAGEAKAPVFFTFDPNTVSLDDLLILGLTGKQATTLINYRGSGARFRRPQDLYRVYGIDSVTAACLIPWIVIEAGKDIDEAPVAVNKAPHDAIAAAEQALPDDVDEVRLIDLNRCTADDLLTLPGIGPVLSERIIKYRRLLGGFVDKEQMKEVYGLDSTVIVSISGRLTLTYDSVTPVLLDSSSYSELARHPYIGSVTAGLIMKYRSLMGTPLTLGDLVRQRVMSAEQAERIAPYIRPSPDAAGNGYEFILSKVLK